MKETNDNNDKSVVRTDGLTDGEGKIEKRPTANRMQRTTRHFFVSRMGTFFFFFFLLGTV
jgi:hypothetical protein